MVSLPNPLAGKSVSLPLIGTIGLTTAIGGGILLYLLLKKRRVTSKTVITRFK